MDLIYAVFKNGSFIELCYLNDCVVDGEVGKDTKNDTTIKIYDTSNLLEVGNYILHEEIGGIIDGYKIDTQEQSVTYHVMNWFGMLDKVVIEPSENSSHRVVDGEYLASLIDVNFKGAIKLNPNALTCPIFEKVRYESVLSVFDKLNKNMNGTEALSFRYENGCMNIRHGSITTLEVVLNNDYGIKMLVEYQENYNHLIALGSGELENRQVLHYFYNNGVISTNDHQQTRRTYVYDYPNVESLEELQAKAKNKLKEIACNKSVSTIIEHGHYNIGDILHVKEDITSFDEEIIITQKIYTGEIVKGISNIKIDYKVGD